MLGHFGGFFYLGNNAFICKTTKNTFQQLGHFLRDTLYAKHIFGKNRKTKGTQKHLPHLFLNSLMFIWYSVSNPKEENRNQQNIHWTPGEQRYLNNDRFV